MQDLRSLLLAADVEINQVAKTINFSSLTQLWLQNQHVTIYVHFAPKGAIEISNFDCTFQTNYWSYFVTSMDHYNAQTATPAKTCIQHPASDSVNSYQSSSYSYSNTVTRGYNPGGYIYSNTVTLLIEFSKCSVLHLPLLSVNCVANLVTQISRC